MEKENENNRKFTLEVTGNADSKYCDIEVYFDPPLNLKKDNYLCGVGDVALYMLRILRQIETENKETNITYQ